MTGTLGRRPAGTSDELRYENGIVSGLEDSQRLVEEHLQAGGDPEKCRRALAREIRSAENAALRPRADQTELFET